MIKKDLSKKDKKDWKDFLENLSGVPNKDDLNNEGTYSPKRFKFDFHGYSIEDANKKIYEIIKKCYERDLSEILIVTGKGIHSNTEQDVYASKDLSKLRYSVPEYINSNLSLSKHIVSISEADKKNGADGAIIIKLKKL